jgi:hypothetical protein
VGVFSVPGSSIPGETVPGETVPGEIGQLAVVYEFIGLAPATYLQYLGPNGTLHVVPGATFTAGEIASASGWPYQLPVPPHDGRWLLNGVLQGGPIRYSLRRRDLTLHLSRAANAARHAALAAQGPAPGQGHATASMPQRAPDPPSEAAMEATRVTHDSRAMNAARHAALRAGRPWPPELPRSVPVGC